MTATAPAINVRYALELLAPLFRYPDALYAVRIAEAHGGLEDNAITAFAGEAARLGRTELESIYTSTFDLAPVCSPYLGIHLFGEDSPDRARLMVGLRTAYQKQGADHSSELPDHIAEVLEHASLFEDEEWSDLVTLVLSPAIAKMKESLQATTNPYRHLVASAERLIPTTETRRMA